MDIGLQVNPPGFSFQYFYTTPTNGTYNFIFEFPFDVTSSIPIYSFSGTLLKPEYTSINSTNTCTVISASLNVNSSHLMDGEVWGNFNIAPTFLSGNRGLYTIVLPFGNPYNSKVFANIAGELNVSPFTPDVQINLNIILPHSDSYSGSFPSIAGMEPFTFTNKPTTSIYWNFANLQNLEGSVTVEYENQSQIGNYENWTFLSGAFIGVGSSILITSIYDGFKKWSEKAEK